MDSEKFRWSFGYKIIRPGINGIGTNPEQLFAAGWSACFEGAMGIAASKKRITLPEDTTIDAEVDLCLDKGNFSCKRDLM
jgi:organic hydroperoxide reductase OsmC/OhrA